MKQFLRDTLGADIFSRLRTSIIYYTAFYLIVIFPSGLSPNIAAASLFFIFALLTLTRHMQLEQVELRFYPDDEQLWVRQELAILWTWVLCAAGIGGMALEWDWVSFRLWLWVRYVMGY